MAQEKGNWQVYNVKAILSNVESIFKNQDINKLNGPTYKFISLHMGFIAHYDLYGFKSTYEDLREFALRLQTSEYSNDPDYNLRQADRQETDSDFRQWYGEAYNKSIAEAIREIVEIAQRYQSAINIDFSEKQRQKELATAQRLAGKYGYEVIEKEV